MIGNPIAAVGRTFPLGATITDGGVNFCLYSRNGTGMELLFFDREEDARPSRVIRIEPATNRTYHYWHVFVRGVQAGQIYGYRVDGPFEPANGMRFDSSKILLDPYGRAVVVPGKYIRKAAESEGDNTAVAMKSVVVDPRTYDWEGDTPLNRPSTQTIIYEMHVKGFTRHSTSGVAEDKRGTFAGLIEKIPYLQQLGITAVELLPVFQFDAQDCPRGVVNYWGYAPVSFFAPHQAYSSRRDPLGPVDEFRDMVKALHRTWSRRCTGQASKSFSMSCTITLPKAAIPGQRCRSGGLTTAPTTSWNKTARTTPISAVAGTRSTQTIPSSAA
jgi:isoamylase